MHSITRASAEQIPEILKQLQIRSKTYEWELQPLVVGSVRATIEWNAAASVAPELVAQLSAQGNIRFEVTQNHSKSQAGRRWSFTPGLGIYGSAIDEVGNTLIPENQIRNVLYGSSNDLLKTQAALRKLLGTAWDDDLERFRSQAYEPIKTWLAELG